MAKRRNVSLIYLTNCACPDLDPFNISSIKWLGKSYSAKELTQLYTKEGICYTFNMLSLEEIIKEPESFVEKVAQGPKVQKWSLEAGYPDDDSIDSYPKRTYSPGPEGGFIFDAMFTNDSHMDFLCKESLQGFKVMLHHPSELPNLDKHFRVPLNHVVSVGIVPKMTNVSELLRKYKPHDRKCYFSSERRLQYFLDYSQENCLSECLANYTLMQCGCLEFYMPSEDKIPICGIASLKCVKKSKVDYLLYNGPKCDCMPSCTALEYDVEISQSDWNWEQAFEAYKHLGNENYYFDNNKAHFSRLLVYYRDLDFLSSERQELFGALDFFSNVGGLLGLFIGFSVTSLIEILYFLTFRLICNIKIFGKKFWSGNVVTTVY